MIASAAPSTTGLPTTLDDSALEELRKAFDGELVRPLDPAYDMARRAWNGMVDKRPALIARPRGTADVVAAVEFAGKRDLEIAVRCRCRGRSGRAVSRACALRD